MIRIAYFEPVNGLKVYGRELLPHLGEHYEIDIYTDENGLPDDTNLAQLFTIRPYTDFSHHISNYTHQVFQVRNNSQHVPVYELLITYGGVSVLHDLNISGILGAKTLMKGRRLAFLSHLYRNEGLDAFVKSSVNILLHKRWPSQTQYMMNRVACRHSSGIIVHNEEARDQIRPVVGAVPIQVVRRGVPAVDGTVDVIRSRRILGLPEDSFIVVSLGFVTVRKRILQALAAFAKLVAQVPNALYILVGQPVGGFDVQGHIKEFNLGDKARLTGWVDDKRFYDYLAAADACINLRYPVEGETSSTALRAMSYGKPTLVSNAGSLAELPDYTCLKISPNSTETESIYEALLQMKQDEQARLALGERAKRYVCEHHTWKGAAQAYHRFLESLPTTRH